MLNNTRWRVYTIAHGKSRIFYTQLCIKINNGFAIKSPINLLFINKPIDDQSTMLYSRKNQHIQQNTEHVRLWRMIRWVVREVAERAGFRNARELATKTGLPPTSVYRIWTGKATRTDLATIDKLCTALDVKPGQLFDHEAEPERLPKTELTRSYRRP